MLERVCCACHKVLRVTYHIVFDGAVGYVFCCDCRRELGAITSVKAFIDVMSPVPLGDELSKTAET